MSGLPNWTPPELPPEVATFDCTDFGNYCARGYNPNGISASIRGVPIRHFTEGQWLSHKNTGTSGSVFVFHDADGRELGRAYKCSEFLAHDLFLQHGKLVLTAAIMKCPDCGATMTIGAPHADEETHQYECLCGKIIPASKARRSVPAVPDGGEIEPYPYGSMKARPYNL